MSFLHPVSDSPLWPSADLQCPCCSCTGNSIPAVFLPALGSYRKEESLQYLLGNSWSLIQPKYPSPAGVLSTLNPSNTPLWGDSWPDNGKFKRQMQQKLRNSSRTQALYILPFSQNWPEGCSYLRGSKLPLFWLSCHSRIQWCFCHWSFKWT